MTTNILITIVTCLVTNVEKGDNSYEFAPTWYFDAPLDLPADFSETTVGVSSGTITTDHINIGQPAPRRSTPTEKWEITTVQRKHTITFDLLGQSWHGEKFELISSTTNKWTLKQEWKEAE